MRHFTTKLVLVSGMLLFTLNASAQWRYHDDDDYNRGAWRRGSLRGDLIGRVQADLDSARYYGRFDGHERHHFQQAQKDLMRFQDNWARGKFDKDRLDGAIGNIDHLVRSDQIAPRDRRVLGSDLMALRDFRANRGYYRDGRGW